MKRSRAPSTLSSTTRAQRRHYHSNQEESQQSQEVDVGMEDVELSTVNDSTAVAAAAGRRRYGSTRSGGRSGSIGINADESGAAASASNGSSNGSSTTSKSRRGKGTGTRKEEAGDGAVTAPASVSIMNGKTKANEACAGEGSKEEGGSMAAAEGDSGGNPPPKKKKKYIRNPETHKEYRARMEAELAQARKMLEEGNAAMVELARDYKRQQALIEQYRAQDNSLVSVSQLSQLQQSQQSQLQHSQQSQLQLSQQPQQGDQDSGGVSGVGVAPATGPDGVLGLSQDSVEKDAEANNHQFSQDNIPSQPSIFSLSLFGPDDPLLDEPLSQVNQWMATLKDSQETWNVDDLQLSEGTGADGENGNTDVADEDFPGPDSIEAMALAAEALSPSKPCNPSSPNSSLASFELSPAPPAPPAPLIPRRGGMKTLGKYPPVYEVASRATAIAAVVPGVVRVGIACIVSNPNEPGCVLIGKRKGSLGAGTLGLPGGHLEVGEEWATCAKREVREETGLNVKNPTLSWVTNSPKMEGGKHYVTIFMIVEVEDIRMCPRVMEPNKCEGWSWEPWESLGSRSFPGVPLFKPLADLKRTTYNPFRVL